MFNQLPRWGGNNSFLPQSKLLRGDLAPLFGEHLTGYDRYRTLSDDVEYLTGLAQELHQQPGTKRANVGEFIGPDGWTYDRPPVPSSEVRFRARLAANGGPWPGLTSQDQHWDDSCLDDYRDTLNNCRNGVPF